MVQESVSDAIALELVPEEERELPPGEDDGRLQAITEAASDDVIEPESASGDDPDEDA